MLGNSYSEQNCSAARALELVGERWSLLILRDSLFRDITQFGGFQKSLGIATNVLASRLESFVANGLMEPPANDGIPNSSHYIPTAKAMALKHVIIALTEWGEAWVPEQKGPIEFAHRDCGGQVSLTAKCSNCAHTPNASDIMARPKNNCPHLSRQNKNSLQSANINPIEATSAAAKL